MKMILVAAAAGLLTAPALAQAPAQQGNAPGAGTTVASVSNMRVNQLIIYGDQQCPQSTDTEIVVCYKPKESPYRIPAPLRDSGDAASNSWNNRAAELQYVGRGGIGSCSPTGPGGASGCLVQFINQARAERQNAPDVNWNQLIDQARQQRLGRIDAESEEIDREDSESQPR